jgi:chromosome segregation ATPase
MLIDLAESEGIPDVLVTFQSAFKMLIEQLKKLSEKASQSSSEMGEIASRLKGELQDRFIRQSSVSASQLVKVLGKAIDQILITKFESLSTGSVKDQKQVASVMQHFIQYSLSQLLSEFQEAVKPLVGDSQAADLASSLKFQLDEHSATMTSGPVSVSTVGLLKQTREFSGQTLLEWPAQVSKSQRGVDKGVQSMNHGISVKSQWVQVDDAITVKKIELLMAANKKMNEQLKSLKDQTDSAEAKGASTQQNNLVLHRKLQEMEECLDKERAENERLKSTYEQTNREMKTLIDRTRDAEGSLQLALSEAADKSKKDVLEMTIQLQEVSRKAGSQIESLKKQLETISDELLVEKKANFQLQERLSQEIQASIDMNTQLKTTEEENNSLRHGIEAQNKEINNLSQELKLSREKFLEQAEALAKEKDGLQKRLSTELTEVESQRQKAIERLTVKITELNSDLAKQQETHSQKHQNLATSLTQMESELDSKDMMIRELQAINNVLTDEKYALGEELDGLKSEIQNEKKLLEADLGKKNRQDEEYKRLKEKVNESGYRMRDLEKENNSLKELRVTLVAKIEELQEKMSEAQHKEKEALDLVEEKNQVLEKKEAAHLQVVDTLEKSRESLLAEIKTLKKESEEIKMKIKEKEEMTMSQISSYEKRIHSLSKDLEDESSVKLQLADLQEKLDNKGLELIQSEHMIEQIKRQSNDLLHQLEDKSSKVLMLEDALKKVVDENNQLSASLKTTSEKLKHQIQILDQIQSEKHILEASNDALRLEISQVKDEVKESSVWESKLTAYSEEIESLKGQLTQQENHNEELTSQLRSANSKVSERTSLLKKANEEFQTLEKEVIELRPMKKEVVNLSITLSKLKEDSQIKEKSETKLISEIDKLKLQLTDKIKEHESLATKFKKTLEDFKRLQDQTNVQNEEDKKKLQLACAQEIEAFKASQEEILSQVKQTCELEVRLKDEKIQQLISSIESKNIDSEHEKNEIISNLQSKIAQLQEADRLSQSKQSSELAVTISKYKEELAGLKKKSTLDLEKVQNEFGQQTQKLSELKEQGRQRSEEVSALKTHLEEASRAISESDDKLVDLKDKIMQKDKVITDLLEANKVLTNTLKSIKRQQNSVPKAHSNQKLDSSGIQNHPPVPVPQVHKIVISSSTERRVENNLITNFEKHLTNNTPATGIQNPLAQYLNNKENTDLSNLSASQQSLSIGPVKKYTAEEYERVLAERKLAQDSNIPSSGLLKPPTMSVHGPQKALGLLSPAKPQGLLTSSVGGLHVLAEDGFGDNGDARFDEAVKGYSSRYSRHSRTSRNSRRSPTPSKEHSSVH